MADAPLPGRGLPQASAEVAASQARRTLLASLVVTAVLFVVPGGEIVGYPLLLISTYVHEMGHGLAAILVGGSFENLRIYGDGSGVALTGTSGGRVARAVVSAGGLVGPAVAAAIGFTVGRKGLWARWFLLIGGILGVLTAVLWVRSLVGWAVALGLAGISLAIALGIKQHHWSQLWLVFLSVQLAMSVFSRSEYLFARTAATGAGVGRSDSASIADALVGPYWFWGGVCGVFSLLVLAYGAWIFLRTAAGGTARDAVA
ncbi:hypothetical protein DVS28_a0475 [Euzebya pacifica]|uniref:M50 family peptidase n=1 Tax=Euzebya pacifica TaxID=1608957 RepID=A0A346XSI5_9ACTN|nr:M50 family metallopeptidase [Euzebya pacifica]AXV05182.1 hypothetical protein DVS28_a0475 [Euzebya pacifica]